MLGARLKSSAGLSAGRTVTGSRRAFVVWSSSRRPSNDDRGTTLGFSTLTVIVPPSLSPRRSATRWDTAARPARAATNGVRFATPNTVTRLSVRPLAVAEPVNRIAGWVWGGAASMRRKRPPTSA